MATNADLGKSPIRVGDIERLLSVGGFSQRLALQPQGILIEEELLGQGRVLGVGLLSIAVGVGLSFSRAGAALGFTRLPRLYWPLLALTLACYLALTQGVKMWLLRRRWI